MIGLKWEDIGFGKRTISVKRTMEFRYGDQEFRIGEPKSKAGYRTIPMTQTAYDILKAKEKEAFVNELNKVLLPTLGSPTIPSFIIFSLLLYFQGFQAF